MLTLLVLFFAILYVGELTPLLWIVILGFIADVRLVHCVRTAFASRGKFEKTGEQPALGEWAYAVHELVAWVAILITLIGCFI